MAYAERRGKGPKPWRVKYRRPDGTEASESGFETKKSALKWGHDQEAKIRSGQWTDPDAGKILVKTWISRWLKAQDVGLSTENTRDYLIRRFILPAWGEREIASLEPDEINTWEKSVPAQLEVSARTARDARGLLCTILGDAAATRPPLIPYNPALRLRNRGRRTGRKLERSPQRAWVTPLQTLLLAERAALMSGHASDFTMIVTIGYTGMRWGETIGLESNHLYDDQLHVEWQLREIAGTFYRIPPKDDSYRSPNWEPCLPVDLPHFLANLLARQARDVSEQRCSCASKHGGTGRYLFIGPDSGHHRRSNYGRRIFRPACDGRHEATSRSPARFVITDASTWPGVPVAAWPTPLPLTGGPADTTYQPPRGRGIRIIPDDAPLACWLPIMPDLTPHGLRHSHKTWMTEDAIPEILAEQRLGHEVPGMRGLYTHTSDRMRDELKTALQARWEDSLRARVAIHPRSPLPLLDELMSKHRASDQAALSAQTRLTTLALPTRRGTQEKLISQIPPNQGRQTPTSRLSR